MICYMLLSAALVAAHDFNEPLRTCMPQAYANLPPCAPVEDETHPDLDFPSGGPSNVDAFTPPPTPPPTHPKLEPKLHYIYWVTKPFIAKNVYDCHQTCEEDKAKTGDCNEFEFDFNYSICYMYKEVYMNPAPFAEFNDEQIFKWAQYWAPLPVYRDAKEHADLIKMVLKIWFPEVSEEDITYDDTYTIDWSSLTMEDKITTRQFVDKTNLEMRQKALIVYIIDSFSVNWVADSNKMTLLIRKLFPRKLEISSELENRLQTKITDVAAMKENQRRLLGFGEISA